MELTPVFEALCRDGVPARVQKVPYAGKEKGWVLFGKRLTTGPAEYDNGGMRNEAGDLWYRFGWWRENATPHPFDLVQLQAVGLTELTTLQHA
jgi:hypothetical protein